MLDPSLPWADKQGSMVSVIPVRLPGKLCWGCSGQTMEVLGLLGAEQPFPSHPRSPSRSFWFGLEISGAG